MQIVARDTVFKKLQLSGVNSLGQISLPREDAEWCEQTGVELLLPGPPVIMNLIEIMTLAEKANIFYSSPLNKFGESAELKSLAENQVVKPGPLAFMLQPSISCTYEKELAATPSGMKIPNISELLWSWLVIMNTHKSLSHGLTHATCRSATEFGSAQLGLDFIRYEHLNLVRLETSRTSIHSYTATIRQWSTH